MCAIYITWGAAICLGSRFFVLQFNENDLK